MSVVSLGADTITTSILTTRGTFCCPALAHPLCFTSALPRAGRPAWIPRTQTRTGNGLRQAMLLLPPSQPAPGKCQSWDHPGLQGEGQRMEEGLNYSRGTPYSKESKKAYRFSYHAQDNYKMKSPMAGSWLPRQLGLVGEWTPRDEGDAFPTRTSVR